MKAREKGLAYESRKRETERNIQTERKGRQRDKKKQMRRGKTHSEKTHEDSRKKDKKVKETDE
jgi:hypothetical protein